MARNETENKQKVMSIRILAILSFENVFKVESSHGIQLLRLQRFFQIPVSE